MSAILPTRPYRPKDSVSLGLSAAGTSAGVGLVVSAVRNALEKHRAGALGVVTRTGGTIALFTTVGGVYAFSACAASNLRESDDSWNEVYAGAIAGARAGIYKRTLPAVFGYSAGVALLMGVFSWSGGNLGGIYSGMSGEEKVAWRKEFFSVERRRPRSQVIEELKNAPGMKERALAMQQHQQRRAE